MGLPQEILARLEKVKVEQQELDLIGWHYAFCNKFGWMDADKFGSMPLTTFFNIAYHMVKEEEDNKRMIDESKSKVRGRRRANI